MRAAAPPGRPKNEKMMDPYVFFVKDDGGGFLFRAGYGFNPVFSLELSVGGTCHDTSESRIDAGLGFIQVFALYAPCPQR